MIEEKETMDFATYVHLMNTILLSPSSLAAEWLFYHLPRSSVAPVTDMENVDSERIVYIIHMLHKVLMGMGLSQKMLVQRKDRTEECLSRFIENESQNSPYPNISSKISKSQFISGLAKQLFLSYLLPLEEQNETVLGGGDLARGWPLPLGHSNFNLQLSIALGFSRTLDSVKSLNVIDAHILPPSSVKESVLQFSLPSPPPFGVSVSTLPLTCHFTSFGSPLFGSIRRHYGISDAQYR